jgi:hypothetical protein
MAVKRATKELDERDDVRPGPELDRDEEEAFEELFQAFRAELDHLENPGGRVYFLDEFAREDEFTCHGCNLILHRTRMSDEEHILCDACSVKVREPVGT